MYTARLGIIIAALVAVVIVIWATFFRKNKN
jgi:hypothetical protein